MIPKPTRIVCKPFLEYVRSRPCMRCGKSPVDAHHWKTRGSGGSDFTAVPLCREHHDEVGSRGSVTTLDKWGIDLNEYRVRLFEEFLIDWYLSWGKPWS